MSSHLASFMSSCSAGPNHNRQLPGRDLLQAHLLHGLAEGHTHASHVQATGGAAMEVGAQGAFAKLARLGTSGKHQQNIERDLQPYIRKFGKKMNLDPVAVDVGYHAKEGGVCFKKVHVFLPHEIIYNLFTFSRVRFQKVFVPSLAELREYWSHAQQEMWFQEHPMKEEIQAAPEEFVPTLLFGDDAPIKKSFSTLIFLFGSPLAWFLPALSSLFPLFVQSLMDVVADSQELLYFIVTWSFNILATGKFPMRDWHDKEFVHGSWRHRMRGKSIAEGFKFLMTDFCGDWKYIKETLMLRLSYAHREVCLKCTASKGPGPTNFSNFRVSAGLRNTMKRSHQELMDRYDKLKLRRPSLTRIRGFHTHMVKVGMMHAGPLGVLQWMVGNALVELVDAKYFGKYWGNAELSRNLQLRAAWQRFVGWARKNHVHHSQQVFTAARLGGSNGQWQWPEFKGKAANTIKVSLWFGDVIKGRTDFSSLHERFRLFTFL